MGKHKNRKPWSAKRKSFWLGGKGDYYEEPKDHEALPDTLDTGYDEERNETGQLYIMLNRQPTLYIVLGKYRHPQDDGVLYYVSDYTINPIQAYKVHKFDHLLLAISQVHDIIRKFEERKSPHEDVHN